jgi:hypothetical protein
MSKTTVAFATALLFGLMLSVGSAFAGDGSCTKGKKSVDEGSAAVITPAQPLA